MIKKHGAYLMESAEIFGHVSIGKSSSIWSHTVIRGDESSIKIGGNTNIQDLCIVHAEHNIPMEIGDNVTIGHGALIHCRKIGSNCLIGMGAILLDNAEIGEFSIIGAGAVVLENQIIPSRSLVLGVPGKITRKINDNYIQRIIDSANDYIRLSESHYEGHFKKFHLLPK